MSTTNEIFSVLQLKEISIKYCKPLYILFIDMRYDKGIRKLPTKICNRHTKRKAFTVGNLQNNNLRTQYHNMRGIRVSNQTTRDIHAR